MIKIITAMIKTKFGFFQVKIKSTLRHAIEFCQTSFCETPERFDTVNMAFAIDKLTIPVMNPEMLIKADIDQSIITTPSIRMDHGICATCPRIMAYNVALEQSGTISVYTLPWRLRTPKTIVLP